MLALALEALHFVGASSAFYQLAQKI